MSVSVNIPIVNGFTKFNLDDVYYDIPIVLASESQVSEAEQALWTNRVPQHEPWPRTLMGDSVAPNQKNTESQYNTSHNPQFVDDNGGYGSLNINRSEGEETIERNELWRR